MKPIRTEKGHRLYNHGHVQQIKKILNFIEKGIPVSRIKPLLDEVNDTDINNHDQNIWLSLTEKIHFCIQDFNYSKTNALFNQILALYPIDLLAKNLLLPILSRYKSISIEFNFFYFFLRNKLIAKLQIESELAIGQKLLLITSKTQQNELVLLIKALTASALGFLPVCFFVPKKLSDLEKVVSGKNIAAIIYIGEDKFLQQAKKIFSLPTFAFLQSKNIKNILIKKGIKILDDDSRAAFKQIKNDLYY